MNNIIIISNLPKSIVSSIARAKEIMEKDISRHIPIYELARASQTNEFTLKRYFKIIHLTTIYQHLLNERMKQANYLLTNSGLLEKEIAQQCGFQCLSGFVSSYKKYYGITPGQFRMSLFIKSA